MLEGRGKIKAGSQAPPGHPLCLISSIYLPSSEGPQRSSAVFASAALGWTSGRGRRAERTCVARLPLRLQEAELRAEGRRHALSHCARHRGRALRKHSPHPTSAAGQQRRRLAAAAGWPQPKAGRSHGCTALRRSSRGPECDVLGAVDVGQVQGAIPRACVPPELRTLRERRTAAAAAARAAGLSAAGRALQQHRGRLLGDARPAEQGRLRAGARHGRRMEQCAARPRVRRRVEQARAAARSHARCPRRQSHRR